MFNFKKNKEKDENKYNGLANYKGDPFTRQLFFFGFYFVFFLVIIILLRTGYKRNAQNPSELKTGYDADYSFSELFEQNYHFVYKENINGVETKYEGDSLEQNMEFAKSGMPATEYIKYKDKFYIKDNNLLTWNETINPISFYPFVLPSNLKRIINNGEYISYITYMNIKEKDFNYEISNNSIRKILDLEEIPNDESKTKLVVKTEENKKIKTITLDLTDYYKTQDITINQYIITISYSKIGKIEEITNPIN